MNDLANTQLKSFVYTLECHDVLILIHVHTGDPLYVNGGQPRCSSDPQVADERFAQDG